MHFKKEAIQKYLVIAVFAALIFVGLKFRLISRTITDISPLYSIWGYCFQDILVWCLFSLPFFFFNKKYRLALVPVFFIFSVNIIFISKTGYPMSSSLFSQMGDLMMLQTSIHSPSVFRNFFILGTANLLFIIPFIPLIQKKLIKVSKVFSIAFILILGVSLVSSIFPMHSKVSRLTTNILVAIFSPPNSTKEILTREEFKGLKTIKWQSKNQATSTSVKNKNIVIVIVETLKYNIPEFERTMPFLYKLSKRSIVHEQHYTPWPFSSKALYSIFCSQPPQLSSVIEMRVSLSFDCQNWLGELINKNEYRGFVGYSGDLKYDNMGKYFSRMAKLDLYDRHNVENIKKYPANHLSIDDQALVDQFDRWLGDKKEPFVSVFITLNSHHPFWTPHKEFEKTKDKYKNTLSYQDHVINNLYNVLEKKNLLNDTILVITGDHGRREASAEKSMIPKSMYHVPLIWYENKLSRTINWPTSHYQIGPTLLKKAVGAEFGFYFSNFESQKPVFSFFQSDELAFTLLSKNLNMVYTGNNKIYFSKNDWPSSDAESCSVEQCPNKFDQFFNHISNVGLIYEK
jgi:hypothetical protein